MHIEKTIPNCGKGKDKTFHLVKLDCFRGGMFSGGGAPDIELPYELGSLWAPGTEAIANERLVDSYIEKFCELYLQVHAVFGDNAMNLILTTRNSGERNRLAAATRLAEIAQDYAPIYQLFEGTSIYLDPDSYNPTQSWVWKDKEFTGLLVEVRAGRFWFGDGDGYHRSSDYEIDDGETHSGTYTNWEEEEVEWQSYSLDDLDAIKTATLEKADEASRNIGDCDEKYWHKYCKVKTILGVTGFEQDE